MNDPYIGTTLAGYRIEAVTGYGGMGVVYVAEHLGLQRKVALKLIAPHLAQDVEFQARFEHEARAAASIDHPNVIPVYDYQQVNGELFMTMRYVHGWDLRTLIRAEGALSPDRAVGLLAQAAAGLDAAHVRGLIHRDVKPANILIEQRGGEEHVYVMDFGLAKGAGSASLTASGDFLGTLDYASPEQIDERPDRPVDHRADIYALGCILFETLSGRPPYPRDSEAAKIYAHLHEPPPAIRNFAPHLPKALEDVILKALAKDPNERPQSAGELGRAAVAAIDGWELATAQQRTQADGNAAPTVQTAVTTRTATGETARLRRRWPLAIGTAGVAVAGIAAAVLALTGGDSVKREPPEQRLDTPTVDAAVTDYKNAYANKDIATLRDLFTSNVERTNDGATISGERRVLREYQAQFHDLASRNYTLRRARTRLRGNTASVRGRYDLTESGECVGAGTIAFHLVGDGSRTNEARIDRIEINRSESFSPSMCR